MLSGKEILKHLDDGIVIKPFRPEQLNPNSYNLRLHNKLFTYTNEVLDMRKENPYEEIIIPEEGYILRPGKLYLGRTEEWTEVSAATDGTKYTWGVDGRSSVGRLGISTHATAGFGDYGFKGYITWEISCIQPVRIYPDICIGQIYYFELTGDADPYVGKYLNSQDIIPSRMFEDFNQK